MKNTLEINEFLKHFNYNSYNREQVGYDKQIIIAVYEFLKKLNIPEELIISLINNIAYLKNDKLNIPLFLDILSRSISFINLYELNELIKVVKEVHDIYYENTREVSLEEYLHDTEETRLEKLFLDRNNKYLLKDFNNEQYINELKFAAALILDNNEYKDFLSYIDNFATAKEHYSPLIVFKTYTNIREHLKGLSKLYWDIYYGNEYIVAFNKHGLKITDIYDTDTLVKKHEEKTPKDFIQLDLFTYQEYEEVEIKLPNGPQVFQLSSLYSKINLPEVETEKDLLAYYNKFLNSREVINLPKLKTVNNANLTFETN